MKESQPIIVSSLSQEISNNGETVKAEIYRFENEKEWTLEIEDKFNNITVWDTTFRTDFVAINEAKKTISAEGLRFFVGIGPEPVKA